jgi:hypothetical protein
MTPGQPTLPKRRAGAWLSSLWTRLKALIAGKSPGWIAVRVAIAVLVPLGFYAVWRAINPWVAIAMVLVAALVASRHFVAIAGRVLGALVVGAVALVGFNVIVDHVHRLPILAGLIVALLVFGAVATWYLWGAQWGPARTLLAAGALTVGAILVAPIIVARSSDGGHEVGTLDRVPSRLDILIITNGRTTPPPAHVPPDPALGGFDVRYAVGYADGRRVRWTLTDGTSEPEALRVAAQGRTAGPVDTTPVRRAGVDASALFLVDGTAPVMPSAPRPRNIAGSPHEVARWRAVARDALQTIDGPEDVTTPVFALLETSRQERLDRWKGFVKGADPVSIQALGSTTVADAAVRLAIAAPASQADFALAVQHRPALFFDSREPVPRPLSVGALFAEGRIRLCKDRQLSGTGCSSDPIREPRDLENGGTHLQLTLPTSAELVRTAKLEQREARAQGVLPSAGAAAGGAPPVGTPPPSAAAVTPLGKDSAIYVHPFSVDSGGRRLLYLDYWWYLPDNPARIGAGAFCGAGLVIPGVTCHDHESDWEGLTVVVDRTGDEPNVIAVQYAEHDHVYRYDWKTLRQRWKRDQGEFLGRVTDAPSRPLAFIARGTHATYPTPCQNCRQAAKGAITSLGENPHDGELEWAPNNTSACGRESCLQELPTRDRGRAPALWSAFTGPWGARHCVLKYYCDSASPPAAPGQQHRYQDPTRSSAPPRGAG